METGKPTGDALPPEITEGIDAAQAALAAVGPAIEARVAELTQSGATPEQRAALDEAGTALRTIGTAALAGAELIATADIEVRKPKPAAAAVDEEAAYRAAKGFALPRGSSTFTVSELHEHIVASGVPITRRQVQRRLNNWMEEIADEQRDEGYKVIFTPLGELSRGREEEFAIAQTLAPEATKNLHLDPANVERATRQIMDYARQLIAEAPSGKVRTLETQLAEAAGLSRKDARMVINALADANAVHLSRPDGTRRYSKARPVATPSATGRLVESHPRSKEELTERDEKIARRILDALGKIDVNAFEKGLTNQQIRELLAVKGSEFETVSNRNINSVMRLLESTGVAMTKQSKQKTGGSQFRIRAASKAMDGVIRDGGNHNGIITAVQERTRYELPPS